MSSGYMSEEPPERNVQRMSPPIIDAVFNGVIMGFLPSHPM